MFSKLAKHRQFEYTPRLFNPEEKQPENSGLRFQHLRNRRKTRSFIWLVLMLAFIVYLMIVLSKVAHYF